MDLHLKDASSGACLSIRQRNLADLYSRNVPDILIKSAGFSLPEIVTSSDGAVEGYT